jgi:DNA polymerase-3 subunit delta
MTFAEFQKTLAAGTVPPVVLFHGNEPYLASLGVALLRKRLIAPGSDAFDFVSLTGRDATAEAIAAHASTAPMLSERRLTVVYEFDALTPSQRAKLVAYLDRPVPSSCLALVSFELLSRGTRFERDVLSRSAVVECGRVSGKTLDALVGRMAGERGREVDDAAAAALVDAADGSLGRIASELDKLACFVPEGRPIGRADVEEAVGVRASDVRDLAVAVAEGDLGRALSLAAGLLDQGVEAAQLVSQMWSHWVGLWSARVRAGGAPGGPGRVWDGVGNAGELAGRRTSREYAAGVRSFLRADVDIRRGAAGPATVAGLLYDLTRGAA